MYLQKIKTINQKILKALNINQTKILNNYYYIILFQKIYVYILLQKKISKIEVNIKKNTISLKNLFTKN